MKQFKYDLLVFILRAQPFTKAHQSVIDKALELSKNVLLLLGSVNSAPTARNPWNFEDRKEMILNHYWDENIDTVFADRIFVEPLNDSPYDNIAWVSEVHKLVDKTLINQPKEKIGLIGYNKDSSSFYLKLFPKWSNENSGGFTFNNGNNQKILLDATMIRDLYFGEWCDRNEASSEISKLVPLATWEFLEEYRDTEKFKYIQNELKYAKENKEKYGVGPFITVDNVVIQAGHVLLVTRNGNIGKNLLALPGGFLEPFEDCFSGAIRELQEETTIRIPPAILRSKMVKGPVVFDYPYRSVSGHLVTHCFLYNLDSELTRKVGKVKEGEPLGLTEVKGSDDASHAEFYPLSSLKPELMHDDHYFIVQEMIKYLN